MNRITSFILTLTFAISIQAQDLGLHFGHQMFGVFNSQQQIHGVSIGLDIPRSGFVTPYGQFSMFLPYQVAENNVGLGEPIDPMDPFLFSVDALSRTMTYSFEFGTIYYFGGAYDYGFSGMIHNSIRLMLMPTRRQLVDFDSDRYTFVPNNPNQGGLRTNGFVLNTSLGIGAKYTFDWGSLYALAGIELALFGERLPRFYFDEFGQASPLAFSTRIGIRRDLDFSSNNERKQIRQNNRQERQRW